MGCGGVGGSVCVGVVGGWGGVNVCVDVLS
jgi:hypothetical protein